MRPKPLLQSHRGRAAAFHEHVRRHSKSASSAAPKPHSLHNLHFFGFAKTALTPLPALGPVNTCQIAATWQVLTGPRSEQGRLERVLQEIPATSLWHGSFREQNSLLLHLAGSLTSS